MRSTSAHYGVGVYHFSSNLPAPINVGSASQTKTGNLIVEGVLRLGQFTTANAPSGTEGALYFDTTDNTTKLYSSSAWGDLGGGWDGILPNYTTTQRNELSLVDGLIVYNTTDNAVQIYKSGAWANVGAKLSLGATCIADGDCDSTHCADGYCCLTSCGGNCDRCNVAGSIGTCTDVASACTGNCVVCSSGNCAAVEATCTGNCDICSGSGTAYSCAASVGLCTTPCIGVCSGSGTAYNCAMSGPVGYICGGGKIAYIDGTGLHGFIAALSDQSTGTTWAAANQLCLDATINNISDWYLPSIGELAQLLGNHVAIGGFTYTNYWSASQYSATLGWGCYWGGYWECYHAPNKTSSYRVRCILAY